ncbi:hypothetical protein RB25_09655 [Herbaspirillum rubrisubalbicans]|nr:hypothetical protein RB25_09655 [Herbaspirillum rubrisubalbicans]
MIFCRVLGFIDDYQGMAMGEKISDSRAFGQKCVRLRCEEVKDDASFLMKHSFLFCMPICANWVEFASHSSFVVRHEEHK